MFVFKIVLSVLIILFVIVFQILFYMSKMLRFRHTNNPFLIPRSEDGYRGKIKRPAPTEVYDNFTSVWYGLRAGLLLLRNGYLAHGFDTPLSIIYRWFGSDKIVAHYCLLFSLTDTNLSCDTKLSVRSLDFFFFVNRFILFQSGFNLDYEDYKKVVNNFRLW